MANAKKDQNGVSSLTFVLNTNGQTIVLGAVNPTTHGLMCLDGTTGSNHGPTNAIHDENGVPTILGVSSSDFSTPVVVYGDSNGNMLVDSK